MNVASGLVTMTADCNDPNSRLMHVVVHLEEQQQQHQQLQQLQQQPHRNESDATADDVCKDVYKATE